jgi:hypothetical protein
LASGNYVYGLYNGISGLATTSNPQPNWRWCDQCQSLFWGGNGGTCWATKGAHKAGSSTSYDIYFGVADPSAPASNPQPDWRYCNRCCMLYFQGASGSSNGVCSAPLGNSIANPGGYTTTAHTAGSSTNYDIPWNGTWA